jgi:hypothetical protein
VVLVPEVIELLAAVKLTVGDGGTMTVAVATAESLRSLVTVSVNVVVAVRLPVEAGEPVVTVPTLWSTLPVPPLKTAVSVVLAPLTTVASAAEKLAIVGAGITATTACAVAQSPASLVTVSVKVLLPVRLPVLFATPVVTVPTLRSTVAVPPVNTPVSVVLVPLVIVFLAAVKLVMVGRGTTVIVTWAVVDPPTPLLTVSVNVVSAVRAPVLLCIPLLSVPTPWSTVAVPPLKVAVSVVLVPLVMVVAAAKKLGADPIWWTPDMRSCA